MSKAHGETGWLCDLLLLSPPALRDSAEKENVESGEVGLQYSCPVFEQELENPFFFLID
jgi:hypothetical protein